MAALGLGRAAPCPTSAANAGPGGERRGRGPGGARGSARLRPAAAPPYKVGRSGEARPARGCRPAGNRRRGPLGGVGSLQPKIVLKKKSKKKIKKKRGKKFKSERRRSSSSRARSAGRLSARLLSASQGAAPVRRVPALRARLPGPPPPPARARPPLAGFCVAGARARGPSRAAPPLAAAHHVPV